MSYIRFSDCNDYVDIRGSERFHAHIMCAKLAVATVDISVRNEALFAVTNLHKEKYSQLGGDLKLKDSVELAFLVGSCEGTEFFSIPGVPMEQQPTIIDVLLNTALSIGNDPLCLLARLDAQCEIHCFVQAENRRWLSEVIADGLKKGVLRKHQNWEALIPFLLSSDTHPVVTSYSVAESFPNPFVAKFKSNDEEYEDWNALPYATKWELAMKGVMSDETLEISPDMMCYPDIYFGKKCTFQDIIDIGYKVVRGEIITEEDLKW